MVTMNNNNNNTEIGYNLFDNDHIFYGVIIIAVSFILLLGIFLLICMIYKPSYSLEENLSLSSHILHKCDKAEAAQHSELAANNSGNRARDIISSDNVGNKSLKENNSGGKGSGTGSSSILDTRLPPLMPQTISNIRPGEFQKLSNALKEVAQHREVVDLGGTNRRFFEELQTLDITSLTKIDNNY